ncbi:MAG: hypothetical protein ACR5LF_06330 [Symbiopectobacterium sp.]
MMPCCWAFDALLLGERIFWDPTIDTRSHYIKGTPPNLRDQLHRRLSSGDK